MKTSSAVEKIVQNLSFEVEAVPHDSVLEVASTKNITPLNLKIKVRKRHEAAVQQGILSVPKLGQPGSPPERIRLISSDQTIMSFNVFMETELEKKKPLRKPRKNFFGGCLGTEIDDDDDVPYGAKTKLTDSISSRSDGFLRHKFGISKSYYDDIKSSELHPTKQKYFFGKCKPGGCLDPPFDEEKYSYTPKQDIKASEPPLNLQEIKPKQWEKQPSFVREMIQRKKKSRDKLCIEKVDKEEIETSSLSILSLYQADFKKNSLDSKYSDSIITYPPNVSSNETLNEKQSYIKNRVASEEQSRKALNEFSDIYFIPPKRNINKRNESEGERSLTKDIAVKSNDIERDEISGDKIGYIRDALNMKEASNVVTKFKETRTNHIKTALRTNGLGSNLTDTETDSNSGKNTETQNETHIRRQSSVHSQDSNSDQKLKSFETDLVKKSMIQSPSPECPITYRYKDVDETYSKYECKKISHTDIKNQMPEITLIRATLSEDNLKHYQQNIPVDSKMMKDDEIITTAQLNESIGEIEVIQNNDIADKCDNGNEITLPTPEKEFLRRKSNKSVYSEELPPSTKIPDKYDEIKLKTKNPFEFSDSFDKERYAKKVSKVDESHDSYEHELKHSSVDRTLFNIAQIDFLDKLITEQDSNINDRSDIKYNDKLKEKTDEPECISVSNEGNVNLLPEKVSEDSPTQHEYESIKKYDTEHKTSESEQPLSKSKKRENYPFDVTECNTESSGKESKIKTSEYNTKEHLLETQDVSMKKQESIKHFLPSYDTKDTLSETKYAILKSEESQKNIFDDASKGNEIKNKFVLTKYEKSKYGGDAKEYLLESKYLKEDSEKSNVLKNDKDKVLDTNNQPMKNELNINYPLEDNIKNDTNKTYDSRYETKGNAKEHMYVPRKNEEATEKSENMSKVNEKHYLPINDTNEGKCHFPDFIESKDQLAPEYLLNKNEENDSRVNSLDSVIEYKEPTNASLDHDRNQYALVFDKTAQKSEIKQKYSSNNMKRISLAPEHHSIKNREYELDVSKYNNIDKPVFQSTKNKEKRSDTSEYNTIKDKLGPNYKNRLIKGKVNKNNESEDFNAKDNVMDLVSKICDVPVKNEENEPLIMTKNSLAYDTKQNVPKNLKETKTSIKHFAMETSTQDDNMHSILTQSYNRNENNKKEFITEERIDGDMPKINVGHVTYENTGIESNEPILSDDLKVLDKANTSIEEKNSITKLYLHINNFSQIEKPEITINSFEKHKFTTTAPSSDVIFDDNDTVAHKKTSVFYNPDQEEFLTKNVYKINDIESGCSHKNVGTSLLTGRDPLILDLAFQSYVNDQNERVVKSLDPSGDTQILPADNITFIKTQTSIVSREFLVPLDSKYDMSFQIKDSGLLANKLTRNDANTESNRPFSKEHNTHDKEDGSVLHKIPNIKILQNTLEQIYEQQLIPLQTIINDLRGEIDLLANQQIWLKDSILLKRKMKSKFNNVTKRCSCYRKWSGLNLN